METGRKVAVKIIKEGDDDLMELVRTETQAMMQIAKHDHVIEQIEVGRDIYKKAPKNGQPGKEKEVDYIVLEICSGGEIFDFVAVSGAFTEDQARYFFS
jgi:serine/threonine protein kinase